MRFNQTLTLYIVGRRHRNVVNSLRALVRDELGADVPLRIIDVQQRPEAAEKDNILATPTLVFCSGRSSRRIIGDLSNTSMVTMWLRGPPEYNMKMKVPSRFERLPTGITGLDWVSQGGFPRGRATLVAGTAGSGKTIFSAQFLVTGIQQRKEPGVFVTFEETADDIRRNLRTLGWDVARWERAGLWRFVDASPSPEASLVSGDYDLSGLLARMEHAVREIKATRVAVDSLGALFTYLNDLRLVRSELYRITTRLKELRVTTVLTAERNSDYGDLTRFNVEEFVADNVVILRNVLAAEKRRRTLEILKIRGSAHHKGEFPSRSCRSRASCLFPRPPSN